MKEFKRFFATLIVIVMSLMIVSCGGDSSGVENSSTVQSATKAFQIGAGAESYDTLKLAVKALQDKSNKASEIGAKAATESYTIKLNWDKTDVGATISGINAEVKLDFQGHVLTLEDGSEGIVISNTGKAVEIANGTIQVAEGATLKSGTTAVITASTDTTLSASINASNTDADAIVTTGGNFSIQGSAHITTQEDMKTIVARGSSVVKVNSSQVVLTGGLKLDGNSDVDLGDATLKLTQDIEKGIDCKFDVNPEKVELQNDNVHQERINEARHNHEWDEGVVSAPATCTSEGERTYTCISEICNYKTKTERIPSLGHSFPTTWTLRTAATELSEGLEYKICTICDYEITQVVPQLEHVHMFDNNTWKTNKDNHWHECELCGDIIYGSLSPHTFHVHQCSVCGICDSLVVSSNNNSLYYNDLKPIFIELYCSIPNSYIYYTVDGSTPSRNNGLLYTSVIEVSADTIIKAFAVKEGYSDSIIYSTSVSFVNRDAEQPKLNYIIEGETNTIELSCETVNSTIFYNVRELPIGADNLNEMAVSDTYCEYSEPLVLSTGTLLSFYSTAPDYNDSIIQTCTVGSQEGWVFYDKGEYADGWRYIEACGFLSNVTNYIPSNNNKYNFCFTDVDGSIEIGETESGFGSGKTNTELLALYLDVAKTTEEKAPFKEALDFGLYVPSIDELYCLLKRYPYRYVVNEDTTWQSILSYISSTEESAGFYYSVGIYDSSHQGYPIIGVRTSRKERVVYWDEHRVLLIRYF